MRKFYKFFCLATALLFLNTIQAQTYQEWLKQEQENFNKFRIEQEKMLQEEIDDFVVKAVSGNIPPGKLTFEANKVYKKEGNSIADVAGTIGVVFSQLADVNCRLWHEQEKVYEFEQVHADEKNKVVKQLAHLNLERNKCIDEIDRQFADQIKK